MSTEPAAMPARLNQVLHLLQSVALPADLADNPERTAQWLSVLRSLQQALALLQGGEGRAMQTFRRFHRMIEGLPETCLAGLPSTAKFGLLRTLLADIEAKGASLDLPGIDTGILRSRLRQCRSAICAMAVRLRPPPEAGTPLPGPA